ncbi:MAG: thioester oxidase [Desulfobacterales bacterium]|nr:MAG: thioester oxidase [Desulfobacterales bacterium]
MDERLFELHRFLLTDFIRERVDFTRTSQHQGRPAPPLQKPCGDEPRAALPPGAAALEHLAAMPLGQAILERESVRRYSPAPLTLEELAALLWATQGVRRTLGPSTALRTVPSAGARHAFETYLAVQNVASLDPGVYRYLPFDRELALVRANPDMASAAAIACLRQRFVAGAAVTFFWSVIPERMEWRYGLAAHKVLALDAGHVCQNLYLACAAMGLGTCAIAAYDQRACDELLEIDGDEEFTVYAAPVGRRRAK